VRRTGVGEMLAPGVVLQTLIRVSSQVKDLIKPIPCPAA
jgi:hypothetical protein